MKNGDWREHWGGMPEFVAENRRPHHTLRVYLTKQKPPAGKSDAFVTIHFREEGLARNLATVAKRLGKEITTATSERALGERLFRGEHKITHHSCWFPWKENDPHGDYLFVQEDGKVVNPKYPVFIISKGRWQIPLTARALERMGVPYKIVVEPKEYADYKATFEGTYDDGKRYVYGKLHVAPENFSERGQGSIPVRNYVWELALKTGKSRHWLMDDNIDRFQRTVFNLGIRVKTGAIFRAVEDFADRYENIALTGLQNAQFAIAKCQWPAFFLNTRVYSCTLIRNDLDLSMRAYVVRDDRRKPIRVPACKEKHWRGRYNEDTDLCIRALKKGWCTVTFMTLNADKTATMAMKGGNTDGLYAGDPTKKGSGRHEMAVQLARQHPDVARVGRRFNRWQHVVNYPACVTLGQRNNARPSSGVLKFRSGDRRTGIDNFGMVLVDKTGRRIKRPSRTH